jgi:serine O-acetyltransferase
MDAIAVHRLAHRLHTAHVPILPRLLDHLIFVLFNSVIHHSTTIGEGTRCVHKGMSVLIHRAAVVGRDVEIGAHVVIGGRAEVLRWPVIEDGAQLGANACILGGVRVGKDAVIGAGAVVLHDVPAGATAVGNPARIL